MRHLWLAVPLLVGLTGCGSGAKFRANDSCTSGKCNDELELRIPQQKVVVDMPANSCQPSQAPCQPPMQMPMNYPQGMMAPATTQVRERTGFGFMFDFIRIPMPIIRPIAIPRPAEMTMTVPVAPAPAAVMPMPTAMMPMPMAAPTMAMMPQPTVGFGSMTVQGTMSIQQVVMMLAAQGLLTPQQMNLLIQLASSGQITPQQSSFLMQLITQGQMTPQQIATMLQGLLGGTPPTTPPPATPPAPPSGGGTATPGSPTVAQLQEQLRQAEQKLKLLEQIQTRTP